MSFYNPDAMNNDPTPEPVSETAEAIYSAAKFFTDAIEEMQARLGYGRPSAPQRLQLMAIYQEEIQKVVNESSAALRRELEEVKAKNERWADRIADVIADRDAALKQLEERTKERDEARAAIEIGQRNCDEVYDDLRTERDTALAELERVTKERDDLGGVCILPEVTQADALIRMERAEVERAQLRADLAAAKEERE